MSSLALSLRQYDGSPPLSDTSFLQEPFEFKDIDISELPSVLESILEFKRIALQFPDELLELAPEISSELQRIVNCSKDQGTTVSNKPIVFILADTASGSCCVDEVAAEHYAANCIIHFGHSCQSVTSRQTPVFFVFPKYHFDKAQFFDRVSKGNIFSKKALVVMYTVGYHYAIEDIVNTLMELKNGSSTEVVLGLPRKSQHMPFSAKQAEGIVYCGRRLVHVIPSKSHSGDYSLEEYSLDYAGWKLTADDCEFLYIGHSCMESDSFFKRFALRFASDFKVHVFDPFTSELTTVSFLNSLRRFVNTRYGYLEAAKNAETIALVYGTVGVAGHTLLHDRLKQLCRAANRQVISLVVGKINVPKFENFPEVDVFCVINCPESSFLPNSKDYSKPILVPFELEVALGSREWTTEYYLDFEELMSTPLLAATNNFENSINLNTRFALKRKIVDSNVDENTLRLSCDTSSPKTTTVVSTLGDGQLSLSLNTNLTPLSNRTFQGVPMFSEEPTPDLTIHEGLSGIASRYQSEPLKKTAAS